MELHYVLQQEHVQGSALWTLIQSLYCCCQGCVLSPLLDFFYTSDYTSMDSDVKLLRFADDTMVIVPIQPMYIQEECISVGVWIAGLWCSQSNVPTTRQWRWYWLQEAFPQKGSAHERYSDAADEKIRSATGNVEPFLYCSHGIRPTHIHHGLVWGRHLKKTIGAPLPSLQSSRVRKQAEKIITDSSHPGHQLFISSAGVCVQTHTQKHSLSWLIVERFDDHATAFLIPSYHQYPKPNFLPVC